MTEPTTAPMPESTPPPPPPPLAPAYPQLPYTPQFPPQFPPQYHPYPPQPMRTNGLAIASMVLGILWIYWLGSILALVFGYVAKRQIAESQGTQSGSGMATAGIVLGWIGVGVFALMMLLFIAMSASTTA